MKVVASILRLLKRSEWWESTPTTCTQVPGRKTDVKDAEWIGELFSYGLLRRSLIPPLPQRKLRDLTRQRTTLLRERASVINRLQKVWEWAFLEAGIGCDRYQWS